MELYYYIFLLFLSIIFYKKLNFGLSIILVIGYCLIIRFSGFQGDILSTYSVVMGYSFNWQVLYYAKEPIFWFGAKYLYNLIGSPIIVLLIYDTVCVFTLFYTFKEKIPPAFSILMMLSFPFLLGIENAYRQFLGLIFLMAALRFVYDGKLKTGIVLAIISALSHNIFAIFIPLLIIQGLKKFTIGVKVGMVLMLTWVISLLVILVLQIKGLGKSSVHTGAELDIFYIIILFLLLISLPVIARKKVINMGYISFIGIYCLFFILLMYLSRGSGSHIERIGMLFLSIIFAVFILSGSYNAASNLDKFLFLGIFCCIMIFPVFFFYGTMTLLRNDPYEFEFVVPEISITGHEFR